MFESRRSGATFAAADGCGGDRSRIGPDLLSGLKWQRQKDAWCCIHDIALLMRG